MSFLHWFGKRNTPPESTPYTPSDLGTADATLPLHLALTSAADKGHRRGERVQRRELLYGVVRECMTAAGLLTSTYKFKVLSLDSSGREYLIMVDVPHAYFSDPERFAEMEGSIARSAKERFDMLVTAVYWRVNDLVTTRSTAQPVHHTTTATVSAPLAAAQAADSDASALAEEALAFKRAIATANGALPAKPHEVLHSERRNPEQQADFSDTEVFDPNAPLGSTQLDRLK